MRLSALSCATSGEHVSRVGAIHPSDVGASHPIAAPQNIRWSQAPADRSYRSKIMPPLSDSLSRNSYAHALRRSSLRVSPHAMATGQMVRDWFPRHVALESHASSTAPRAAGSRSIGPTIAEDPRVSGASRGGCRRRVIRDSLRIVVQHHFSP